MSQDYRALAEWVATLACERGSNKRPECACKPCVARRLVSGANDPVQVQETFRAEVVSLKSTLEATLARLEKAEAVCEASDRVEPHTATLEMRNRWVRLCENLKAWRSAQEGAK